MNDSISKARSLVERALATGGDERQALRDVLDLLSNSEPEPLSDDGVLRNIIGTIPHFVFWKDRDCVYQGANSAFASIAGFRSRMDIAGKTDYDLPWKKEEADFFVETDKRVMSSGIAQLNIIEPQKQADGRERLLETSKVPLRNEAGEVVGILGMFQDVTERKQMEEELLDAKEAAEASDQAKGEFLAAMSHELRTPLTLILGPMESMLQDHADQLPPELLSIVQRSHRNACRLKALTDDILDFSKGQAGLLSVSGEQVDMVEHIRELINDMQPAAFSQRVTLAFESAVRQLRCQIDVRKVDKMLLNLVGNALKFTPTKGRVTVGLKEVADTLQISVTDTGIGIDPANHKKLFQKFVQVDASSTRKYGGTGLGLALVKQFCDLMGGNIVLDSAIGEGSVFTLSLPIRSDEAVQSVPPAHPKDNARADAVRRAQAMDASDKRPTERTNELNPAAEKRPRLLIAEDNLDLRSYIVSLFEPDYFVEVADSGAQALRIAETYPPDVILSDVMMPEMDGFQLLKEVRVREHLRTTPVILLTARAGAEASAMSLDSGADDYVNKPFNPMELKARVRAAHRLSRLNAELRDAQAQAAETERLAGLGRLLAKLAHELNNPVNVITNSADSVREYTSAALEYAEACAKALPESDAIPHLQELRDELDWEFVKEDFPLAVAQISEAASRVKSLQTDFRLFLRGDSAVVQERGELNEAVLSAVEQARRMRTGIGKIQHRLGPIGKLTFDHHRLGQALLNIIKNASEASGERGLVLVETVDCGGSAQIIVTDSGPGVPQAVIGKIFEPFFTTKDVGLGTGLGLAIGREVVEHHGGTISVENTRDSGARFIVELPKEKEQRGSPEAPISPSTPPDIPAANQRNDGQ